MSQLPRAVPSRTPSVVTLDATITSCVSLSRQITTVKQKRDDSSGLAAVTAELHKLQDENEELRSALEALCHSFQVSCSSFSELVLKYDSAFAQLPLTEDVADYTS